MAAPRPAKVRYTVEPRGIAPAKAARRLGLALDEFLQKLPELLARGFPPADVTTGNYDLKKIDAWMDGDGLTEPADVRHAPSVQPSMGEKFRATKERKRNDRVA